MEKHIDRYQVKLNTFTAEIDEPIDRDKRTLITCEADIYEESERDNGDGTFNKVYRCKVNGSTIIKQGDKKPILAKSKMTQSQKIRQSLWVLNPEE